MDRDAGRASRLRVLTYGAEREPTRTFSAKQGAIELET